MGIPHQVRAGGPIPTNLSPKKLQAHLRLSLKVVGWAGSDPSDVSAIESLPGGLFLGLSVPVKQ